MNTHRQTQMNRFFSFFSALRFRPSSLALTLVFLLPLALFSQSVRQSFDSGRTIRGTQDGTIQPYPAIIQVEGMPEYLHKVTISFPLFHTFGYDELDILLEAPDGQFLVLMSDLPSDENPILNELNFSTEALDTLSVDNIRDFGVFLPANYGVEPDTFPAPIPEPIPPGVPDIFSLLDINPNGTWKLYVADDTDNVSLLIMEGGWSITIEAGSVPACRRPGPMEISEVTDFSAKLSFQPGSNNTQWDIYLTDNPVFGPDSDRPITLENVPSAEILLADTLLQADTEYWVWVRADCGDLTSAWRGPVNFKTGFNPCANARPVDLCTTYRFDRLPAYAGFATTSGNDWAFSFTPPEDGDYWVLFHDRSASNDVYYQPATADNCPTTGWKEGLWNRDLRVNRMDSLVAGQEYLVVLSGGGEAPAPFQLSACPIGALSIDRTDIYTDSIRVKMTPTLPAEAFEVYLGPAPIEAPGSGASPTYTSMTIDEEGYFTLTGLEDDTEYAFYIRTRCDERRSCWLGPFTVRTETICTLLTGFQADTVTTTWAGISFQWPANPAISRWTAYAVPAGSHPARDPVYVQEDISVGAESSAYLELLDFPAHRPTDIYLKASCDNTNQPWQGPYRLPLGTAPPVPVIPLYCGDQMTTRETAPYAGRSYLSVSNPCFQGSGDERIFRYRAGATGTIRIIGDAYGPTPDRTIRAAWFAKSASELPSKEGWTYLGCWEGRRNEKPLTVPTLELAVEKDSVYYILYDETGRFESGFRFRIANCVNPCPPVSGIELEKYALDSFALRWDRPVADGTFAISYLADFDGRDPIQITGHPDSTFLLTGDGFPWHYDIRVRAFCPDGSASDWVDTTLFIGLNPSRLEALMTICNPRLDPPGGASTPRRPYEIVRLNVPEDGEYRVGTTNYYFANDAPPLLVYEDDFSAERPQDNLLAGVYLRDRAQPFLIRADTVLTLSKEKDYYLVSNRRLFTEDDYLSNTYLYYWVDGPGEATLSAPTFNGRAARAHGRVINFHGLLESQLVCLDTSDWFHFYALGEDFTDRDQDYLMLSLENYPGFAYDDQSPLQLGDIPGASRITNPPAEYLVNESGWFVMNRFWNAPWLPQPPGPIRMRFYYTDSDFLDLQDSLALNGGNLTDHEQMVFYKINGIHDTDVLSPLLSHPGVPAATGYDDPFGYWEYQNGAAAGPMTWRYGRYDDAHYGEMLIRWLSGGGGGHSVKGTGALDPVTVDVAGIPAGERPLLYPNPFVDELFVEDRSLSGDLIARVEVVDLAGQEVVNRVFSDRVLRLDMGHLPAGLYLVKLRLRDGGMAGHKMVKGR